MTAGILKCPYCFEGCANCDYTGRHQFESLKVIAAISAREQTALRDAGRQKVREELERGTHKTCPCCGSHVKKERINV